MIVTNKSRGCDGMIYGKLFSENFRARCALLPKHDGMCIAIDEQGEPVFQWRGSDVEHNPYLGDTDNLPKNLFGKDL